MALLAVQDELVRWGELTLKSKPGFVNRAPLGAGHAGVASRHASRRILPQLRHLVVAGRKRRLSAGFHEFSLVMASKNIPSPVDATSLNHCMEKPS